MVIPSYADLKVSPKRKCHNCKNSAKFQVLQTMQQIPIIIRSHDDTQMALHFTGVFYYLLTDLQSPGLGSCPVKHMSEVGSSVKHKN